MMALSSHPRLLILDDPTSGLDTLVRRDFMESIVGLLQEPAPRRADPARHTRVICCCRIRKWEESSGWIQVLQSSGQFTQPHSSDRPHPAAQWLAPR